MTDDTATSEKLDCITKAACYKAEARGFAPARELDDWLEAEAEFEKSLLAFTRPGDTAS